MTLYLSGPMRGYPNFNFDLFHEVTAALRARGHFVFNPAEHDENVYPNIRTWPGFESGDTEQCPQFNLPHSLAWDFARIVESDGIAMLPKWKASTGAKAELFVAEACGRQRYSIDKINGEWTLMEWLTPIDSIMAYPTLKEVA